GWGKELAAALATRCGVHGEQVLVGIAEGINGVIGKRAQRQVTNRIEQLDQLLVALGHGGAELAAVDVEVVEQALEVVFALGADRGSLDVLEDRAQRLVEIGILAGTPADIGEQRRRQDVE